jgi:spermidine/putrescine transport system substrate-binding protein
MNEHQPPVSDPALLRGLTQRRFSRRDLLRYAGTGAGAFALSSVLAACGVSGTKPKAKGSKGPSFDWSKVQKTGQLNFANWPYYIDSANRTHPTLDMFEKDTGIDLKYAPVIQDNESFFATIQPQLQAGQDTGYDIIVITNGLVLDTLQENEWLIPLDHSKTPNFNQYADPSVKNPSFDPGNRFTMAWQSGLTGIGWDPDQVKQLRPSKPEITSFQDLMDTAFKGKIGMFGDNLDLPNLTMIGLGIDPATSTPDDWRTAADALIKQRDSGVVRKYYVQDYIDALGNGDVAVTMAWSGDIFQRNAEDNTNLQFTVPSEGAVIWTDNMMIPVNAAHPLDAITYMDYVYQPKIAALIADWVNYITPVPAARDIILNELEDPAVANSPLVFPEESDLANTHRYRVLKASERQEWTDTFTPIYQS